MKSLFVAAFLLVTPAFAQQAQQPPDPEFMQKAISVLQQQRNTALDSAAALEAKVQQLNEKIMKLEAEIKDLKEKASGEPKPKPN